MRYSVNSRAILLAMVVCAFGLSGCEYYRAVSFVEDGLSGKTKNQLSSLHLISENPAKVGGGISEPAFSRLAGCKPNTDDRAGALLFAPFVIDAVLGEINNQFDSLVDDLKKKSQKTYKASVILPNRKHFAKTNQCLVFLRTSERVSPGQINLEDANFAFVMGVAKIGENAFQLRPLYLKAKNAVAITASGEPIGVSVAFVGKAAIEEKGGNKVSLFAEKSFTISNVKLGEERPDLPQASGLIALYPNNATALELTVAITETGSGIPDEDKARAELKSLFDAVGPKVKEAATGLF